MGVLMGFLHEIRIQRLCNEACGDTPKVWVWSRTKGVQECLQVGLPLP